MSVSPLVLSGIGPQCTIPLALTNGLYQTVPVAGTLTGNWLRLRLHMAPVIVAFIFLLL